MSELKKILNGSSKDLMATENVCGVARGLRVSGGKTLDEEVIVVLVTEKKPKIALSSDQIIPLDVQGVRTDVREIGYIRALSNTGRVRPIRGGFSVGHFRVTAGTLGCFVKSGVSDKKYILSNNHVIADSNNGEKGDTIIQPGSVDGGRPATDTVATLYDFAPINFGEEPGRCNIAQLYASFGNVAARLLGSAHRVQSVRQTQAVNVIDAALALPVDGIYIDENIIEIGVISDIEKAYLGLNVKKSGRTTGLTIGSVELLDAIITVDYGSGRKATFEHQIITGFMSQGGDSGSLLVSKESKKAVALLFAGSDQVTIYNPITAILDYFGVNF